MQAHGSRICIGRVSVYAEFYAKPLLGGAARLVNRVLLHRSRHRAHGGGHRVPLELARMLREGRCAAIAAPLSPVVAATRVARAADCSFWRSCKRSIGVRRIVSASGCGAEESTGWHRLNM